MKKAVITILGTVGGSCDRNDNTKGVYNAQISKALYKSNVNNIKETYAVNTFPILINNCKNSHHIIAIHTSCARDIQIEVLKTENISYEFCDDYLIKDDKDFKDIFALIDRTIDKFDEVIVDVSHGFRHLPILLTVDLIIQNFKNIHKVKQILFAKEIEQYKKYEIIDLKEYLDLANISFILSTFEKNYTVSNHIKSDKYKNLLEALDDFSNDIMALNLNNLYNKSSVRLIKKLKSVQEVSIKEQAEKLANKIKNLSDYKDKKRYQTYFDFSKDLFDKNYMLLALALLFESIRMYIKTTIKKSQYIIVGKVEKHFEYDLYKIGDFCKNLQHPINDRYKRDEKNRKNANLSEQEYEIIKNEFDKLKITSLYKTIDTKRNNLAHANSQGSFVDIKIDIENLIKEYEIFISAKTSNDLLNKFNNR